MNEIEILAQKMMALLEADERLVELELAGRITLAEREAWLRENAARRDAYGNRMEKLIQTGSGTTPVLTLRQAEALRSAVRQLQVENIAEAAVRALLNEALSAAEAVGAAPRTLDAPQLETLPALARRAPLVGFVGLALVAVAATAALVARTSGGRRGGRP